MDWLYQARPRTLSPTLVKEIRFRDINPDFTLNNDDIILTEHKAVQAQMRHVLSTVLGSESFDPFFGSMFPLRLYEPISAITGYTLELDTYVAINRCMGGVVSVYPNVSIVPLTQEDGYQVDLPYIINAINSANVYSFEALR